MGRFGHDNACTGACIAHRRPGWIIGPLGYGLVFSIPDEHVLGRTCAISTDGAGTGSLDGSGCIHEHHLMERLPDHLGQQKDGTLDKVAYCHGVWIKHHSRPLLFARTHRQCERSDAKLYPMFMNTCSYWNETYSRPIPDVHIAKITAAYTNSVTLPHFQT